MKIKNDLNKDPLGKDQLLLMQIIIDSIDLKASHSQWKQVTQNKVTMPFGLYCCWVSFEEGRLHLSAKIKHTCSKGQGHSH